MTAYAADEGEMCPHARGFDCDGRFHYCRSCGLPLDDCSCPPVSSAEGGFKRPPPASGPR